MKLSIVNIYKQFYFLLMKIVFSHNHLLFIFPNSWSFAVHNIVDYPHFNVKNNASFLLCLNNTCHLTDDWLRRVILHGAVDRWKVFLSYISFEYHQKKKRTLTNDIWWWDNMTETSIHDDSLRWWKSLRISENLFTVQTSLENRSPWRSFSFYLV